MFLLDTLLKLLHFVLMLLNTEMVLPVLLPCFYFLDLVNLLETPVQSWMKVLSTGSFSSHRSQIEAFKVCPLNIVLILEVINMCWQIKDAHFILSVSKNITINDSFLLNVVFFSDFGMILRIFSQSFTIVSLFL